MSGQRRQAGEPSSPSSTSISARTTLGSRPGVRTAQRLGSPSSAGATTDAHSASCRTFVDPEKNRDPADIVSEVRSLVESGVSEVTLLGQTVNSYSSSGWDFPLLLRAVARVDGIRRVRFTSPHPNDVTEALVETMAEEPTVCEQLHLPVQSGSNRTLKRMLRRYTVESFMEKVEMVRESVPDIALSTDVIVAFPGETDAEFRATLDLMREVRFDEAFTYRYSPRDGDTRNPSPAPRFHR